MPIYRVIVADRETGEEAEVDILAASENDARNRVAACGLLCGKVHEVWGKEANREAGVPPVLDKMFALPGVVYTGKGSPARRMVTPAAAWLAIAAGVIVLALFFVMEMLLVQY